MDEMGARRRWWLQIALAGITGAVMVPIGTGAVIAGMFAGTAGFAATALLVVVLFVALMALVAQVAPEESRFGGSGGGRVFWAVLVATAGTVLWLVGWSISDEARLGLSDSAARWMPATALLFALVAGVLLRRWYLALGSVAALTVSGLVLLQALAATLPSDVDRRAEGVDLDSLLVATVPGYGVVSNQLSWQLRPLDVDPNVTPPSPFVQLHAVDDEPDCQIDPYQTRYPAGPACEVERPGLFFVQGQDSNAYAHRVDGRRLVLVAPKSFDRDALRNALLSARATEPAGSFIATVPAYTATSVSSQLTVFTPDDRTLLPGARNIEFSTRTSFDGQCTYGALECVVESPSLLRYERFEDTHTVVRPVGGKEVTVRGGLAVGRDVLRTAALAAHPPSDDELRAMLPQERPSTPDRSPMWLAREVARTLFG
ncbi:hypothetical protein [Lentzea cavernae]|uniref:Uncharacterized protein n=1 Tax=Lentzea cavernae TaxID=2020703 RepID=A0ABQ3MJ65_9PSEU|nr:hypothetical protein [Lentzea cavernae]GHH39421.1 hypothetical protein GCM10017774_31030 [Lentzea cavernae]